MGLSLTNHHTAILYLPLLLWITLEKWREIKGKEKFLFFFFLLLGLLPYLYLPIRSRMDPPLDWGNPENFKNFFRVITRYQYGGFSVKGWKLEFLTYHIKKYLQLLFAQYSFLVFLGLGIIKGLKERKKEFIFLFLFYVLYSFFYALIVSFNPYIRHPSVHIGVFYIPSFMIFACFIGKGLEWCVEKEKKVFPLLWLLPLILLYLNLPYSSRRKDYTSYNYGMEVLSKLPPKSIVFVNHGDRIFIFWYLQWVEGKREDVIFLSIQSLKRPVYLERMRKLYPQVSFPSHEEIKRYVEEVVKNRYPPVFIVYLIIENIIEKNIYQRPIFSNEVFPQRKFKFVPCPPLYQIVKK
ncbi:MAG TPA: hypothetical protein ENG13_06120 [bacterium]|nr:hypothetical protein [bacterium]HEX68620.1 hypothetical protein [bacterium]